MRLIFDHQAFSLQDTGGITRYFFELLQRFCSKSDVNSRLLLGFSDTSWPVRKLGGECKLNYWGRRPIKSRLASYALNELLLSVSAPTYGKSDIYHSTLYRFMPAIRAKRRVATHHDCIQERFPELFPDHGRIIRTKRRMFAQADLILCISESSRKDLEHFYGVEPSRCRVIYNGVTPMALTGEMDFSCPPEFAEPFLLYVGSRASYKNFDRLLRVFAHTGLSSHFRLMVMGGGSFTPEEQASLIQLGLQGRVFSIPLATPERLAAAYRGTALLVYPSLYEGFGLPPLEAMSAGTPALVASSPATREVCGKAAFFFEAKDEDDFAHQLLHALEDGAARMQKVQAGLDQVKQYNWDITAEQTLQTYRELL